MELIVHEASVGFATRGMISHINDKDILRKFTEGGAGGGNHQFTNRGLILERKQLS